MALTMIIIIRLNSQTLFLNIRSAKGGDYDQRTPLIANDMTEN